MVAAEVFLILIVSVVLLRSNIMRTRETRLTPSITYHAPAVFQMGIMEPTDTAEEDMEVQQVIFKIETEDQDGPAVVIMDQVEPVVKVDQE